MLEKANNIIHGNLAVINVTHHSDTEELSEEHKSNRNSDPDDFVNKNGIVLILA